MKKNYVKLKASLARTAGLMMLLMAMLAPLGAWGQVTILSENFDEDNSFPTTSGWDSETIEPYPEYFVQWAMSSVAEYFDLSYYDSQSQHVPVSSCVSTPNSVYAMFPNMKLISNEFSTDGYTNISLSFKYFEHNVWGGEEADPTLKVYYRASTSDEWTLVETVTDNPADWMTVNVSLPDGTCQVAFEKFVDNSLTTAIDDIVITGIPAGGTAYAINITNPITGGSVTSNPATQAYENSTVTLTAAASTGYTFNNIASNWSVVDGSSNPITVTPTTDNKATFTMPGSAVTVSATFTALTQHSITCNTPTGGTVSTYPTQAYMGDQVNIYAYPTSGYTLTALTATYTDEYSQPHDLGVTTTNTTFTMPDYDVTVNATFELADLDITVGYGENGNNTWAPIPRNPPIAISQMIYNKSNFSSIPEDGISIKKLTMWTGSNNTTNRTYSNVRIYITTTDDNTFSSFTYKHLNDEDLVWTGSYTAPASANSSIEITLDKQYVYDGQKNLLVCFYCKTTDGDVAVNYRTFNITNVGAQFKNQEMPASVNNYTYNGGSSSGLSNIPAMKFSYVPVTSKAITKVETNCNISTKVNNVEVTRAEPGETVALAYSNVATHYTFNSWNVHQTDYPYTAVTVTDNIFIMPGYAVTVEAVLDEETKYDVEFAELEHGYFGGYSGTSFYAGSEVYFAVNPHYGYNINTVTVTDENEGNVEVTNYYGNNYYFIMPGKNVTVNATFTEKASNNITINKIGGNELCTVTASVGNPVYQGTNVTLNVNEPEGYALSSLSASYNDGENNHDLGVTTSNRSFTMPAYPVTVNAEFAGMLEIGHVAATSKNIVIKMYDSYGDGWNGNYLTVSYNDGTSSENLQLSYGSSAQYTRTLNPGVTMTVSYVKGPGSYTYPSENSFTVEYQGGAMIYQSSGTPYTGMGCDITNPDNSTVWLPIHRDNYYSMSEMIYNRSNYSSLEGGIIVSTINFWTGPNNNSKTYNDVKVYMKATSYDDFTQTDYIGFTNADLVFEGSFTAPASNDARIDLTLDTPFRLSDINQNIVVGVYSEGNNPGSTYPVKFNSFEANNCGSQWNQWISNIETYNPGSGSTCNSIPALGLTYAPIPSHNISYMEPVALGSISGPATATEGAVVTLVPSAATGYVVDVITVTKSDESGTCDVNEDYQFTMPTCDVSVSATFKEAPACVATFHVNGLAIDKETKVGIAVSIPEVSVPAGYTFYGWSNTEIPSSTTTAPLKVAEPSATEFIPTGDCDIYAVFAKAEAGDTYTLMSTPSFEDGGSYIIGLYNANDNVTLKGLDISDHNNVNLVDIVASAGVSTQSEIAVIVKDAGDGWYSITSGDYYLYGNGQSEYKIGNGSATGNSAMFKVTGTNIKQKDDNYMCYCNYGFYPYSFYYSNIELYKATMTNKYYTYIADAPISGNVTITGDVTVTNPIIIGPTAVVTVTGTMTSSDPANIIIKDGGELILANGNTGVKATVEKEVTTTSSKDYTIENWYTIGSCVDSPYINDNTQPNHVENMIVGNYDLYYLDYTKEKPWINYRDDSGNPKYFNLVNGRGYIYANQSAQTLQYKGDINVSNMTVDVNANHWNLIANPFAQTIEFSRFDLDDGAMEGYYALDGEGAWLSSISTADVKNNQGILVHVPAEGSQITISRPENDGAKRGDARSEEYEYVEINVSNASYSDRAYATFTKGNGLPKYNHFNDKIQKVYIPQDGSNFAIACIDDNATVFPVNFKAVTTGKYSISLNATEEINYLVLVDNMTGEETDMLLEDSYTFIGSPRDDEGRFTVKLGFSDNTIESETFVYQNGNELIINGEGTLQMIDMLGRVVMSKEVYGKAVSVDNVPAGAYIIRMIGSEVKTQKIVIR